MKNTRHTPGDTGAKPVWPFRLNAVQDLRDLAGALKVTLDTSEDISILTQAVTVGSLQSPNALAIQPMEGCDSDAQGRPSDLTFRRYERFAAGGAGLLWFEAMAVVPEGRANPRQLWINDDSLPAIRELVGRTRQAASGSMGEKHRPLLVAQLTHSGRYARPESAAKPLIPQHNPFLDAAMNLAPDWPILDDDYLDRLPDAYVRAAKLAFEAGFDTVDIKSCHGYLLNELFACHGRPGKFGGSFENRVSLLLTIVDRIRAELGATPPVTARLGVYDAIPYPFGWGIDQDNFEVPDLAEPLKLVGLLAERGVQMVNMTIANPYYNPHYSRPFNEPTAGAPPPPEHPLVGVSRIIHLAGQLQQAYPQVAIVGSGYSWLRTLLPQVGAAALQKGLARFIGAGRMGLAYPDFPADLIKTGRLNPRKVCIGCSRCTQMMRDGVVSGCPVRDQAAYGPIFRQGREGRRDDHAAQ
jgi:2,4-dienoyl-CoA reductase-like NADH-dependent reductase (Old Yellow Enzyme family)